MNPKSRLGRGLQSLISTPPAAAPTAEPAKPTEGLAQIPVELIDPNPMQPRGAMDPVALEELTLSVKTSGIIQPVLALSLPNGRYQLIAGHRRTEAAKKAGLATVPAIIRTEMSADAQAEWALIENIQRQDLNPIERAKAYKAYIDRFNLTHAQAAEGLGEDRTVITNHLRLLELTQGVQDLISRGLLTAGHAKVLAGLPDKAMQDNLANQAIKEGMSVRKLEELATQTPALAAETATTEVTGHTRVIAARSPHILELEQELSRKLGTKVRIVPAKKKNTGKLIIQYFSLDEFDRIVEKF